MRKILGLDNSQLVNAQKFIVNDSVISDKHDIANAFHNYFTAIGHTLASSITNNTNLMSYINIVEPTLYIANVTNNDVRSVIHGLKIVRLVGMVFQLIWVNNVSRVLLHH